MKSQIIIAIASTTAAVKLGDAPDFFSEPTWRQTWPSASGLVQLDAETEVETTICNQHTQPGVTCEPSGHGFFANGMVGNEDLKQIIDMKGVDYRYAQKEGKFATGNSGWEDLNQDISMKNDRYHYAQVSGDDKQSCGCGKSGLCEVCRNSLSQDGYVDKMGYSAYNHPYFPGTTTPNFNINQDGKCLTWERDGNLGND